MLLMRIGMHDGLQVSCNSVCTCTESTRGKKSPHNIATHNIYYIYPGCVQTHNVGTISSLYIEYVQS